MVERLRQELDAHFTIMSPNEWFQMLYDKLQTGALAFVGDYITSYYPYRDDIKRTVNKIRHVLNTEPINTIQSVAGLNPAYSLYTPKTNPSGYKEYTKRIKRPDELDVEALCIKDKLTKSEYDQLRQVGIEMGLNVDDVSTDMLCKQILKQFDIERGEREKMQALYEEQYE